MKPTNDQGKKQKKDAADNIWLRERSKDRTIEK